MIAEANAEVVGPRIEGHPPAIDAHPEVLMRENEEDAGPPRPDSILRETARGDEHGAQEAVERGAMMVATLTPHNPKVRSEELSPSTEDVETTAATALGHEPEALASIPHPWMKPR